MKRGKHGELILENKEEVKRLKEALANSHIRKEAIEKGKGIKWNKNK